MSSSIGDSPQHPVRLLIWDFDGTLGYRHGGWGTVLIEVLGQNVPEIDVTPEQIRPHLQTGFPWHTPERPHPHLRSPDEWWQALSPVFERAFRAIGLDAEQAHSLARHVPETYAAPLHWRLFDDVLPTLTHLSSNEWTHVVLSNHVPELPDIVRHLGLGDLVAHTFSSAQIGYEKPHLQAFRTVTEAYPASEHIWMIGDSLEADVVGAMRAGIPAILVRKPHRDAPHYCAHLSEVPGIVGSPRWDPKQSSLSWEKD
jgi:putative hydrolase of the HAD superfamily